MSGVVVGKERKLIHYEACGRGSPVIFLHGWLGSWRYWAHTMETIGAAGFRAYAFDFWGFGDSDRWAAGRYSVDSYVDQLAQLVYEVGVASPMVLVGHALGAVVAAEFARSHPDAVSSLVLVSPPLNSSAVHPRRVLSVLDDPETAVRRHRLPPNGGTLAELRKTDASAVAANLYPFINPVALSAGPLPKSVLIIHGIRDRFVDVAAAQLLAHAISSPRVVVLACGHFPMLEDSAVFNRLLNDLLDGVSTADLQVKAFWQRRQR